MIDKDINGYSLSRDWFDFCFENPERVRPVHTSIYFFAIEHCNRLGWKDKFGFPSQMVMEAIGVKNWKTYSKALGEIVDFGFIKMLEISKNQYSSNIIAIVKNTKADTKALDKALSKHSLKQVRSTVSIIKQLTSKPFKQRTKKERDILFDYIKEDDKTVGLQIDFDIWWKEYPIKKSKKTALASWLKSTTLKPIDEMLAILNAHKNSPDWVKDNGEFIPYPSTYLNQERWEDEIISGKKQNEIPEEYDWSDEHKCYINDNGQPWIKGSKIYREGL